MTHNLSRIYYQNQILQDNVLTIEDDLHHYLINVMRLKVKNQFLIFNQQHGEFLAEVIEISKKSLQIYIKSFLTLPQLSRPEITLFFSPIKHHRMQIMIEKATELGATAFQPILMQHSVVREFNLNKYLQIATQAIEQSGRFQPPKFYDMIKFDSFLNLYADNTIFWGCERMISNNDSIPKQQQYCFLIGPEGGFSEFEKAALNSQSNIVPVSIGNFILRAETAAIAFCARINHA